MKMKRNALVVTVLALSLAVIFVVVPTFTGYGTPTVTATLTIIDEYEVMYSSNTFVPRIWLKNGGIYIGQLVFKPDGSALPPDSMSSGQVSLYYHLEDFQNCIDLLRNENPVYLLWTGSGTENENGIKTTAEPVGEGEERENSFLVVRGEDNGIWYSLYDESTSTWNAWEKLPGATLDSPAATIVGNQLQVVVRGMDGSSLWQGYINLATDSFSGWTPLTGATPSAPELTSGETTSP